MRTFAVTFVLLCSGCGPVATPVESPLHLVSETSTASSTASITSTTSPTTGSSANCGESEWQAIVEVLATAEHLCFEVSEPNRANGGAEAAGRTPGLELQQQEDAFFEAVMTWEEVCPGVDRGSEMAAFETEIVAWLRCGMT